MVSADSSSAIERIRLDAIGPGQHFAIAATEVSAHILARGNEVTVWSAGSWHTRGLAAVRAQTSTTKPKQGGDPNGAVPDEYRWETSL